jgi:crotonobetainyl-CoA:carnitine CoA-transferase CaiB-like acyl-CoA transferase
MTTQKDNNSSLGHYRILDLAEGGCMIGGRMLADLGADVIKIEPPGGSQSRIGPFYKNTPDPEKSLYWFAYNINKRGITLDIASKEGKDIFIKLVKTSDAIIESFQPGYMDQLGLGYNDLAKIKSDIVLTSITPFGQDGPKSQYKGCDLTAWASGGYLYVCGDPDRPPVWISFPQASLHAGAEAASGTMTALWHRRMTKEGQHVDVSMQECTIACCFNAPEMWDMNKVEFTRFSKGINIGTKGTRQNAVWKCKDGQVVFVSQGGVQPFVNSLKGLVEWMSQEGMADDWLKQMDWAKDYDASKLTQSTIDRVETAFARFLMTKTKKELYEDGALNRRILIGPLSTTKDIKENTQLQSRGYWQQVEHPELNDTITYPGPFSKISEPKMYVGRRAPLIGEHNSEIYSNELGIPSGKISALQQSRVI